MAGLGLRLNTPREEGADVTEIIEGDREDRPPGDGDA